MAIFAYCRSVSKRVDDPQVQIDLDIVEDYARLRSWRVKKRFIDYGISSTRKFADRLEGARLLKEVKAGDVLICPSIVHVARNPAEFLDFITKFDLSRTNLHFISQEQALADAGAMGLMVDVAEALDERKERKLIRQTSEGRGPERERTQYIGGKIPFGWKVGPGRRLIEIEEEQQAIKLMFKLRKNGMSLRGIRDALRTAGFTLSHQGVQKIIELNSARFSAED